jgi:hypothetical protein
MRIIARLAIAQQTKARKAQPTLSRIKARAVKKQQRQMRMMVTSSNMALALTLFDWQASLPPQRLEKA